MVELLFLGPILTLVFIALVVFVAWKFGKGIIWLIINSVIGIAALLLLNYFTFFNITINIWSILIVALGGIPGIIIVVLLSYFGIAF